VCLVWALVIMYWRTGSVVPQTMAAGLWGGAWLLVMTGYLPWLKRRAWQMLLSPRHPTHCNASRLYRIASYDVAS